VGQDAGDRGRKEELGPVYLEEETLSVLGGRVYRWKQGRRETNIEVEGSERRGGVRPNNLWSEKRPECGESISVEIGGIRRIRNKGRQTRCFSSQKSEGSKGVREGLQKKKILRLFERVRIEINVRRG